MSVSVSLILSGSDGNEFDTRDFDSLPRIGETIIFTSGVIGPRRHVRGMASCAVTDVQHDYRVGYTQPVHAWVTITPNTDEDRSVLAQLFENEPTE